MLRGFVFLDAKDLPFVDWCNIPITLNDRLSKRANAWFQQLEAAVRSYDRFAFASCGRNKERDTTKADLLFLPCKLADHFAATIKELQD